MDATAQKVLSSLPSNYRCSRYALAHGWEQLRYLSDHSESMDFRLIAQGILYADQSCRTTGAISMALRNCSPWQVAKAIATMYNQGVTAMNQVPSWLNQNGLAILYV